MSLRLLSFRALLRMQAQTLQGSTGKVWNLTVGSTARAILEANASVGLWMQWLIVLVAKQSRLATSTGVDVDSFVADFGLTRLPASYATGQAIFSRATAGLASVIPVGTTILTADRSQSFVVTGTAPYALTATTLTLTVPVQAVTAGIGGNIQAGGLGLMASAVPGVDTVSNTAPFAGGVNAETDASLRTRFPLYVDSRSRAVSAAVAYAIVSLRQGLVYAIQDAVDPSGVSRPGFFTVVIDDGTGNPPQSLLGQLYQAIDKVRPLGVAFAVVAPSVIQAQVSLVIQVAVGYDKPTLIGQVAAAVLAYVDALPIGQALGYSSIGWVARNVTGVINATAITVNGGAIDVGGGPTQVVRSTVAQITVA